tara:strand:+ start:158 stop:817 length:660 start_codon:yes stop_codon:yes gene_type:complete
MTWVQALGPLVGLPCLALLLTAVYREQKGLRHVSKPLCSAAFILTALLATPPATTHAWAYAGLGLSLLGDVFLLGEDRRALGAGIAAFLAAHVCYLVWVLPTLDWAALPLWTGLLSLPLLAAGAWILHAAWPRLGSLKAAGVIYFLALSTLTWAALAAWLGQDPTSVPAALRGVGLTLFFASDLAVARQRVVSPGFVNRAWGLPTYYAAQHLLALSLAG